MYTEFITRQLLNDWEDIDSELSSIIKIVCVRIYANDTVITSSSKPKPGNQHAMTAKRMRKIKLINYK